MKKNADPTKCTWAIHNFDKQTKLQFAASCKSNDVAIRDRLAQLIKKDLKESGFTQHPFKTEGK